MGKPEREFAFTVFSWIYHAQRGLHINELQVALAIRVTDTELPSKTQFCRGSRDSRTLSRSLNHGG
jgi:hypothetical protein